jgi:predicted nucleotidyltransferase
MQPSAEEIAAMLRPFIAADTRILAAYLLGSAVSGRMRPDSDIDVALLFRSGQRMDALERAELGARIGFEIGRDVDMGELGSGNLIYAKEALLTGRRIFSRDTSASDVAEATLLGMYTSFNEERREVLDAYRA